MAHAGTRDIDIAVPRLLDPHSQVYVFKEHEEALIKTAHRVHDVAVDEKESTGKPPDRAGTEICVCP